MVTDRDRNGRGGKRRGFTLLEVLLAIGLIVLMSSMMFLFYDASLKARDRGTRMIVDTQLARVVAMKIADEIRSANEFGFGGQNLGVSGDDRMIRLQTVVLPDPELLIVRSVKDAPLPAQSDVREVQYYLAYDEDETYVYPDDTEASAPLGLVRREIKTLNQVTLDETNALDVDLDLVAPELKYLRFRYFDGHGWVDKWDKQVSLTSGLGRSLPPVVEVTVGYVPLPPETEEEISFKEEQGLLPSEPEPYATQTYTVTVHLRQAPEAAAVLGGVVRQFTGRAEVLGWGFEGE